MKNNRSTKDINKLLEETNPQSKSSADVAPGRVQLQKHDIEIIHQVPIEDVHIEVEVRKKKHVSKSTYTPISAPREEFNEKTGTGMAKHHAPRTKTQNIDAPSPKVVVKEKIEGMGTVTHHSPDEVKLVIENDDKKRGPKR